jgi:hypothetical protein
MFGAFVSATGAPPPYFNLLRLSGKADGTVVRTSTIADR